MSTFSTAINRLSAAFNSGDAANIAACYCSDATQVHVMLGTNTGRAAIQAAEAPMFKAFSNTSWKADKLVESADGKWHAVEWTVSATNSGPLATPAGELPATGRAISLSGASLVRLGDDGLIAEERRYFDTMGMLKQLGIA